MIRNKSHEISSAIRAFECAGGLLPSLTIDPLVVGILPTVLFVSVVRIVLVVCIFPVIYVIRTVGIVLIPRMVKVHEVIQLRALLVRWKPAV